MFPKYVHFLDSGQNLDLNLTLLRNDLPVKMRGWQPCSLVLISNTADCVAAAYIQHPCQQWLCQKGDFEQNKNQRVVIFKWGKMYINFVLSTTKPICLAWTRQNKYNYLPSTNGNSKLRNVFYALQLNART